MKPKTMHCLYVICFTASAFILTACGKSPSNKSTHQELDTPGELRGFFTREQPRNVIPVAQARQSAKPGDRVSVTGRIGGTESPFTEGFAAFILADESLVFCSEKEDENCSTPWDACCENPEKIVASRTTVQFLTPEGRPVAKSLKGVESLAEMDRVIISGIVNDQSTPDNLIINATSLYQLDSK